MHISLETAAFSMKENNRMLLNNCKGIIHFRQVWCSRKTSGEGDCQMIYVFKRRLGLEKKEEGTVLTKGNT